MDTRSGRIFVASTTGRGQDDKVEHIKRLDMAATKIIGRQIWKDTYPKSLRNLIVVFVLAWFIPRPICFNVGSLDITPQRIVGIILFLDIVFRKRIKWSWVDLVALGPFLTMFICTLISVGSGRAIESTGRSMLDLLTPYLIGRSIAEHPAMLRWMVRFILHCLALLATLLALESLGRINIHCLIWGVPYTPHPVIRFGMTRAHGWTSHAIMLGLTYAAFAAPAATFALEETKQSLKKWLFFGLILSGVFFSLSTGSWFTAFVALAFLCWDRCGPGSRKARWQVGAMCAIGGYLALEVLTNAPLGLALMYHIRFLSKGWLYRWMLWERVTNVMPGHWLFGYGEALPEEFTGGIGWSIDNHYLVLLLMQGWFGLGMWLIFNGVVLWRNIKHTWLKRDDAYTRILRSFGFSVIGFLAAGLTVAFFSTAAVMLFLAMGIAATSVPGLRKWR